MLLVLFLLSFLPTTTPSASLAGIAHIALRVTDVPKSREFYRTLGYEEAFGFSDPGKPPVSYVKVNDRQYIELYQRADDSQPLGLMHVCYEAGDIDSVHDYYVQHEVAAPVPRKARAGNMLFVFKGPEGETIEFTQYMPGSLHFQDRGKHLGERRTSDHMLRPSIPVKDIQAERTFYTSKLGFEDAGARSSSARLRVPGGSGEEIELEGGATKPRVVFTVSNVRQAADDLRSRTLKAEKGADSVSVTDPDGAVLVFVANGR